MLSTAFYVLLFGALVSVYGVLQSKYVHNVEGIFNVTIPSGNDFSTCHWCLVTFIGINRIDLIQASQTYRVYWLHGRHTNVLKAFLSYCNSRTVCRISASTTGSSILNDPIQSGYQHVTTATKANSIETIICLFAASIAKKKVEETENYFHSQQWNYDKSLSMRQQVLKIAVSFDRNLPAKKTKVFNDLADQQSEGYTLLHQHREIANKNILETESLQNDHPSMRCIIVSSYREDAVCRECLAMHSASLAIRTYFLFKRSSSSSAELCVFRSIHESSEIIKNCKGNFCSVMQHWKTSECDQAVDILAIREQGAVKINEMHDDTIQSHRPAIPDEKRKSLEEITQILKYLARKRMARVSKRLTNILQTFTYTNIFEIPKPNKLVCIKSISSINKSMECISRILKNVAAARVVIFVTATNAILLVGTSDHLIYERQECNHVTVDDEDCKMYTGAEKMNTEMYENPLKPHYSDEKDGSCHISYHNPSGQRRCYSKMRKFYSSGSQKPKLFPLTDTSVLVDTSEPDSEETMASNQNHRKSKMTYTPRSCHRIQEAPDAFCSEHQAFIKPTPMNSCDQVVIHEFTKNRIPVGLWPPKNHIKYHSLDDVAYDKIYSHFLSNSGTELWPAGNSIAFVEYECEASKQIDCVRCVLQHTEVYLSYDDESTTGGYVWMRPAPSVIANVGAIS
ncbi:hypothetical protein ABG067_007346 [Albugo candida]